MSGIIFNLSPHEVIEKFKNELNRKTKWTRDWLRKLQRESFSQGLHPRDYEQLIQNYIAKNRNSLSTTCPCCNSKTLSILDKCMTCGWDIPQFLYFLNDSEWEKNIKDLKIHKKNWLKKKKDSEKKDAKEITTKTASHYKKDTVWENLADRTIRKILEQPKEKMGKYEFERIQNYLSLFPKGKYANQARKHLTTSKDSKLQNNGILDLSNSESSEPYLRPDLKTLKLLAEQGNIDAQKKLGKLYFEKESPDRDYPLAFHWFFKAVKHGDPEANYYLGEMYRYGYGIPKDLNLAKEFYKRSAKYEYSQAQKALLSIKQQEDIFQNKTRTEKTSKLSSETTTKRNYSPTNKSSEDDELWEKAKSINTAAAYNEYLGRNPNGRQGRHFREAQSNLKIQIKEENYKLNNLVKLKVIRKPIKLIFFSLLTLMVLLTISFKEENYILLYQTRPIEFYVSLLVALVAILMIIFATFHAIFTFNELKDIPYILLISIFLGCSLSYAAANYKSFLQFINYIF